MKLWEILIMFFGLIISVFSMNYQLGKQAKEQSEKMQETNQKILDGLLAITQQQFEQTRQLISDSIKLNEKRIDASKMELQREMDRRISGVVYTDTCQAKYDGLKETIASGFAGVHKRLDDTIGSKRQ